MKQGTIKYSQEFISPTGLKRWVGIEMPVDFDTEDYLQVYENVASMVAVCGSKPPNDLTGIPTQSAPAGEALPTIDRGRERLKDRIWDADTVESLTKLLAHIPVSDNELNEIWRAKHNQLSTAK